ncbi:MAG: hypothetical protein EOM22_19910 [Gammaproteobacteria bacterium]|jgi:hypothetical protein|nr:hypothetical protein [Gammaproteobacteria bacterium]
MANLTITVDDEVLKQARMRALEENSSVNAILGRYLQDYAQADAARQRRQDALDALLALARQCGCGRAGKTWTREDLHER